jgi:hypothetical protein
MTEKRTWQRSSFSQGDDAPNCLEVAGDSGSLLLRESDDPGSVMAVTAPEFGALVRHLRTPLWTGMEDGT